MKAFRLGKSKKNSKGNVNNRSISTMASSPSLRSLRNGNQSYTNTLYSSLNRPSPTSPSTVNMALNPNTYTTYTNNNNNNSINRNNNSKESSPKSISRSISGNSKNQIVPEFRVGIRLRPLLETEQEDTENNEELVYLFPQNNILCIREPGSDRLPEIDDGPPPPPGTIAPSMGPYISTNPFNYVFSQHNSQEEVYFRSVHPLVEHYLNGKNSLVLAYGQMGSGKTYTIGFQPEDYNLENFQPEAISRNIGFVPRAFQEILTYIRHLKSQGRSANLLVTFIAISCEDIADLLGESITRYKRPPSPGPKMSSPNDKRTPTAQPKTITVHDRGKQGTYLKGAKYERVESMERLAELLYRGTTFRRIVYGPDSENLSHAILSFHLEQDNPKNGKDKLYSKLNFVDLSCTEKVDKVEARMNRMECGVNDKSWLALSKVINLLTGNRPKGYIPYRDSKLTQVLQDSLSGDALVLFLSCLSPTACDESKSVLKYMIRSTNIDQRLTVVQPKILKSILYNLENFFDGTSQPQPQPQSQSQVQSQAQSSSVMKITPSNQNSLGRNGRNDPQNLANISTSVNIPTPTLSENGTGVISPTGSNASHGKQNQSLDSINTSMGRLAANTSLLFSSPDTPSPLGSLYDDEIKRRSMPYVNNLGITAKNSIERPPRRPVNATRASMNMNAGGNTGVMVEDRNTMNAMLQQQQQQQTTNPNRNSQMVMLQPQNSNPNPNANRNSVNSMQNVPSINSLRNSLIGERKSSLKGPGAVGMTKMLEEQLNGLSAMVEENANQEMVKGHRKKNSEGKKHISFHKRVLSFHKAMRNDGNNNKQGEESESILTNSTTSVPMNDYHDMEKMKGQNDEAINHHITYMLDEIKNTIGDKGLVSGNGEEMMINDLKFIENLGNVVPKPVPISKNAAKDLLSLANSTPPPKHPPPPLPTEAPLKPPSYSTKNNGNGNNNNNGSLVRGTPRNNNIYTIDDDIENSSINSFGRKNSGMIIEHDLNALVNKGKSVLKNSGVYTKNPNANSNTNPVSNSKVNQGSKPNMNIGPNSILNSPLAQATILGSPLNSSSSITASPIAYIEDMAMEDMNQAELNKYITNLSTRLKNTLQEVKDEKDKCDLLRQKEKNLERKLRIRDEELEALNLELDEKVNSFNNAVKVLVMQLGMAQESKNKTQEELNTVEYRSMELAKSLETISELMNGERKNSRSAEDKYHHFVAEYEEEINILQNEKSQIIHEKDNLQQQNTNLQSKINKLVKTLKKFQVNLIESEKRNYYETSVTVSNLKNENGILKHKLDEINQTKAYIENRYQVLIKKIKEYEKELEGLKEQLRESEEAHQAEVFKLLDRLSSADAGHSSSNGKSNSYILELENKLEQSFVIQKELKEKLQNSEAIINMKSKENKELENQCNSYKKSLSNLQDTVNTYENHQTKLLNTNYNLSSQLNGKKGKSVTTRSYSGFRIMHDIKKMSVNELQDEVVELRQEIENMNKRNWDLKLEQVEEEEEENPSTIEGNEDHTSFTKEHDDIRNSNSSMNSRHESNTTLLNSEVYEEEYPNKPLNRLPVLSEVENEVMMLSDEDNSNLSSFLMNKPNSSSSSTAVNIPIHAMPNHEGFIAKEGDSHSLSQVSSSSDFSMIKVNDEKYIKLFK
ncbi:hypothetical protein BCR32DRAFT_243245 [Anaeromyces robustus]|uniref:Kinesin motor domain-containing protein n=1 Tax=Anaeromyces robustus TaxID=1754192 RepID=A0A1Y1XD28_9FUNG|nr:hypothetical protein BCR32DRAFT_243245 [Anaeromyces robustus]|eukprot:ORX83633.1 hypothetical protein BCR32DRAFT_243245 [Anaeromyces robustus]